MRPGERAREMQLGWSRGHGEDRDGVEEWVNERER